MGQSKSCEKQEENYERWCGPLNERPPSGTCRGAKENFEKHCRPHMSLSATQASSQTEKYLLYGGIASGVLSLLLLIGYFFTTKGTILSRGTVALFILTLLGALGALGAYYYEKHAQGYIDSSRVLSEQSKEGLGCPSGCICLPHRIICM